MFSTAARCFCAASFLFLPQALLADGEPVLEPVPITGAYTARHVGDRDHISIIEFAGDYGSVLENNSSNFEPRAIIAREYYRTHPDDYDFLVAFSTFEFNTGDATAMHWGVQNKVQGIGLPQYDNTEFFGSNGKLQGFIDMAAMSRYTTDPLDPDFEKVQSVLAHEVLHQWVARVHFKEDDGSLSDALLGRDGGHWSFLLNTDASVAYGNLWKDNGDGSFTSSGSRSFYSPLDLYLMGLNRPEEVPPFFLIENEEIDKTRLPQQNVTITGTKRWLSVDDIIAAEGPRVPSADAAQKDFRLGFILLTSPGESVSDAQIAALNNVRTAYMTRFAILTGGRAVAEIHPVSVPDITTGEPVTVSGGELSSEPADIDAALAWLRAEQLPEGHWLDKTATDVRDTTLTLQALTKLDPAFNNGASTLEWLEQHPSGNTDYLARYAIALNDIGSDSTALCTELATRQNSDGGFGVTKGYQSDPLDTALVLLALSGGPGDHSTAISNAAQYLLGAQNSDGGFSPAAGGPSRTSVTTITLAALKAVNRHTTAAPTALAFLSGKQNPDGGFGDSPSTIHDTANALQAFMAFDALDQIVADNAADYLIGRQNTSGSWEESVYSTASAVMALKRFKYPNWVVSSVSAEPVSVKDGDRIELTIRVRNDSNVTAPEGVLRIYDGEPSQGIVASGADIPIPAMAGGTELDFTHVWDSFNKTGTHTLSAVADPDQTQAEMSERDNLGSVSVTVEPAPQGIDLTFGEPGLSYTPESPERLPTTMSTTLNIRNLGLTDAENVRVVLWDGEPGSGTLVGETTLTVPSRSTVAVNFPYELTRPGPVVLTAEVDPDNAIAETSEINNTFSEVVKTQSSVDLVVHNSDIRIDTNPALVGNDVTFSVTLRNEGTADTASTEVLYVVTDGTTTQEILTNSIQLAAGESTEQTVTWRVDLKGELTFSAQVDPDGLIPELDDSNNAGSLPFSAGEPSGVNLAVSYRDFTFTPDPGREGYSAVLSALVRNTGTEAVSNAEIAFYNGDPTADNSHLGSSTISTLGAGESTLVEFTWEAIPTSGDKLMFLVADPQNTIDEFSEEDNTTFNVLSVLSLPDLALSAEDLQLNPQYPKAGDSVLLSVRVANLGEQEAADVSVLVYDGDPENGGSLIGESTIAQIDGHGTGYAEVNWAPADAKLYKLYIQVDPADTVLEQSGENNNISREVIIQDDNLSVTQKYFSPNGDGVKDTTQLVFAAQGEGEVEVHVINKRDKVVRRYTVPVTNEGASASITWDGLDDLGRLVEDGTYRLRVVDGSPTVSEAVVHLDTNRSSLLEAAGTQYESYTNLTCDLPDVSGFTMTDDDSRIFFVIPSAAPDDPYQKGVYSMAGDGTDVRPIVPHNWENFAQASPTNVIASGDGSRILFTLDSSSQSYWVADGDGRNLAQLNSVGNSNSDDNVTPWHISQDGTVVYVLEHIPQTDSTRLLGIQNGGIGEAREIASFSGAPQLSPESSSGDSSIENEPNDPIFNAQYVNSLNGTATINGVLGVVSGSVIDDQDFYRFYGREGDLITLDIDCGYFCGERSVDTVLYLFGDGPNYPILWDVDDTYSLDPGTVHWFDARIDNYRLPYTGYYTVGVTPRYNHYGNYGNGDYILIFSGMSSAPLGTNSAFSPDGEKVALLTQGDTAGWVLSIIDLNTGISVKPLGEGVEIYGFTETKWAPNSKFLAVSDTQNQRVLVFEPNGNLVREFNSSNMEEIDSGLTLRNLEWSSSGAEFAFRAFMNADSSSSGQPGGLYFVELATGEVGRAAGFRSSSTEEGLDPWGSLYWVPGERSLLYREGYQEKDTAILLDENNLQMSMFDDWAGDFSSFFFSPTGRQAIFGSDRAAEDATSACYQQGYEDFWSFKSLLNLTADLRAFRSARTGGVQLKGTAADANFKSYQLDYTLVETPDTWHPVMPPVGNMVVDDLFTPWIPPGPGNYLVRLTVEDLAGNVRHTIKRVSWSDSPSITDVYRTPALISPNGDGENDNALIRYRVLEPVHLSFEFFNESGTRVRVISREHGSYGVDAELSWDGRDQNGLVVPDGRYRMTVQNYEFFVTVDNTPPETLVEIRDAYQVDSVTDPDNPDGPKQQVVSVDPGLFWSATDTHLYDYVIESGLKDNPSAWAEQSLTRSCNLQELPQDDDPDCNALTLDEYVGHIFRIEALDTAGNRSVSVTGTPTEQLIVDRFGNQKKASCEASSATVNCEENNEFLRLGLVPYAPMTDINGGLKATNIELNSVRFSVAETIERPVAQLFVQYRPVTDTNWRESVLDEYLSFSGSSGDADSEKLSSIAYPTDHRFHAVWDLEGVGGGETYIVHLRAVDSSGQEFTSNAFRFYADGLSFLGMDSSSLPLDIKTALLSEHPPAASDYTLWGREFLEEEIESVRLMISSSDDPRFATPQVVAVADNPDTAFLFQVNELETCKTYTGYLEATTVPYFDSESGTVVSREVQSAEKQIKIPCIALKVETEVVPASTCGDTSAHQTMVKFAPASLDNKELKLLTLSRPLPDGNEDVLFNVNNPDSVVLSNPPAVQVFPYTYVLDAAQYPEGYLNLTAKLLNVDEEETVTSVPVKIDLTPPVARLTYPLENQRLCGIPVQMDDGTTHNTLTFEGEMIDAGGFHYTLALGEGAEPDVFSKFHDSRTQDSFISPSTMGMSRQAYGLFSVAGPIGQIYDKNGEFTVRLEVSDAGGYKRCDVRTFHFDGLVEGAHAVVDRRLFSPNDDEQFDEVVLSYSATENVTVDVDLYPATASESGGYRIVGEKLWSVLRQETLLAGEGQLIWAGRDASGNVLPDGWYGLRVTITDTCGNEREIDTFTEVDNSPPEVSIAYPVAGDPLPLMVEVQGEVNDKHLLNYNVEVGAGSDPGSWMRIASGTKNTNGLEILDTWNTYGLEGGYVLRLVAVDTVGNAQTVEVPVSLEERLDLISYLEVVPELFSPNEDGKLETIGIRFGLETNSFITLSILDASGAIKRTIYDERAFDTGSISLNWDGRDDAGNVLPDGRYAASLFVVSADNPLIRQDEKVTLIIDRTAPTIQLSSPDNGFLSANGNIVGTIQDTHLDAYDVSLTTEPEAPNWFTLDGGTSNKTDAILGNVNGQEEGDYALKIVASDLGETKSTKIIPFIIDRTPPVVAITSPEANSVFGTTYSPVTITGTLEETYLANYELSVGAGTAPTTWTSLVAGESLPLPDVLHTWAISAANDGLYTLRLRGEDMAGNTGESRVLVSVDNTEPSAAISSPSDGSYVTAPQAITGTAIDENFEQFSLALSPGSLDDASQWSELNTGLEPVNDASLFQWETLPSDGLYTLRLMVKDIAGNTSSAFTQITVDSNPPLAPTNLAASLEAGAGILSWDAGTEVDLAGYVVYRDGIRLNSELVTEPGYNDEGLIEGRYVYTVKAVDQAGWESELSSEAVIVMDKTPPTTRISWPSSGATVSGLVDIKGTAYSDDDFKEYRLYVGEGVSPGIYRLLVRSPVPMLADILGQWNTLVLEEGAEFNLKLEAEDINGNIGHDQLTVKVDNLPPAAPTGLAVTVSGSDVRLTWNANSESDLLGYLVFRNDRLANLSGVLVGSLKPYAVQITDYTDLSLGDGPYTYHLLAIDNAGNISAPSAVVEVSIDTRAPHVAIVQPEADTRFDNPLYVLGSSPDTDIASVSFQYRPSGALEWQELGPPDTALPYETSFDPVALNLEYGAYQLQAIAVDQSGKIDPAPSPITVHYKDVTPPSAVRDLTTLVNSGDVTLTWSENTQGDLAGYHVDRIDSGGASVRLTDSPVTLTSYTDSALADGTYTYTVTAVDLAVNSADPSNESTAIVYTPVLTQPDSPTTEAQITLSGYGITPAVLSGTVSSASGNTDITPVDTDSEGQFTTPISLGEDVNTITVSLTDSQGNVSKPASVGVVYAQPPSKPTGLTANVAGYEVGLTWNVNPEDNVVGYHVFREGEPLLTGAGNPIVGLTATASSEFGGGYAASNAVDTSWSTYWLTTFSSEQWLAVNLPQESIVSAVNLVWYDVDFLSVDFDIQAWSGSSWLTVVEVRDNNLAENNITLPKPYLTEQLRIFVRRVTNNSPAYVVLRDIKVFSPPLVSTASFNDVMTDGVYSYAVSAVNIYGLVSEQSDPASAKVGDTTPPDPLNLNASAQGSDVTLSWQASSAPDAASYSLYRDGSLITTLNDPTVTEYIDADLANGDHTYVVTVTDNIGNESAPSNEETVTVAVNPPPVPVELTVNAVVNGGALELMWSPGSEEAVAGYRLFRSTVAGGPYEPIDTVTQTQYRDEGLINGTVYYYVVAALDEPGNLSGYSNDVSAIPQDLVAPSVSLSYPAAPGNTYRTTDSTTTVAGLSEAGASIALYRSGQPSGSVRASTDMLMDVAQIDLSSYQTPLSPDGRYLATHHSGDISVYDFLAGSQLPISDYQYQGDPVLNWTHDGKHLLYTDYDATAGANVLRAYQPSDQSVETMIGASEFSDLKGAVVADSATVFAVLAEKDAIYGLWRYDAETNSAQLLKELDQTATDIDMATVRWSPSGQKLAYVVHSPSALSAPKVGIIDVATGAIHPLEQTAVPIKPSWSPDSAELLFTALHNGTEQIWRHRLFDNVTEVVTSGPDAHTGPRWLPDNRGFTAVQNNARIVLHERNGNVSTFIEENGLNGAYTDWVGSGYLLLRNSIGVMRIAPAGRFSLRNLELAPGDNAFTAIASDASGNLSAPSMPVVVNYDRGDLPDFALSAFDVRLLPSAIVTGDTTKISVTVRNEGALASPNSTLSLVVIGEEGDSHTLLNDALVAGMQPQSSFTLSADWTPLTAGTYTLVATVDAYNDVIEANESNNFAIRGVAVAGEAAPVVSVELDNTAIGSNESLTGKVTLSNSGESVSGLLVISLEDEQGYLVQTLSSEQVSVAFGDTQPFLVHWDSGSTFAGIYRLKAELRDTANALLAEESQSFTLNSTRDFTADVATDKATYGANDNVGISGKVTYQAGNEIVSGARLSLTLIDANGVMMAEKVHTLGDLMPGAENAISMTWNTGLVVGEYTAQLKLETAEEVLAAAQSAFSVESTGPVLKGTLSLSDASPAPGTPQWVTYTLENAGNTPATDKPVQVVLADVSGNVLASETSLLDLAPGATTTAGVTFDTTGLSLSNYQILLQSQVNDAQGVYETLAKTGFTLVDRETPVIAINSPEQGGFAANELPVIVYARDAHSSVERVDVRLDSGAWQTATIYNAAQSLYSALLPSMQEGVHGLEARASDAYGNVALAGPITFTVDNTIPEISVVGVVDGGIYNHDVAANVSIDDANLVAENVSLNGADYTGETLTEEGAYELLAAAWDAAGNSAQITWLFEIDKTAPLITIEGGEEGGLYATSVKPYITISDRNLDSQSVTLNGETFLSGSTITDDGLYSLSATATDAATNRSTASVSFEIDQTPPDAPAIIYPAEGETVNDRIVDITGVSEPNATLYLATNNTEVSVFADSAGEFIFPQVDFNDGNNSFSVYAKDRAGNVGPATTINFYVLTAELTGTVHAPTGTLVLIPDTAENSSSPIQVLIESTLDETGHDYLIVHTETAFLSALRTNRYAEVLITELHPVCDKTNGNCGKNGTQLKLSLAAEQELRAVIAAGTGLIWIKPDSDANERFSDVLGAKPQGVLPSPSHLVLEESPASDAGQWELSGVGLNAEPEGGVAVGQLLPYESPALVLNTYGQGPVALVTFNPSEILNSEDAQNVIHQLVTYAKPVNRALLPGGLAEVTFRAEKLRPPVSVRFEETLEQPLTLVQVIDGTVTSATSAEWERELSSPETRFTSLLRVPDSSGTYNIHGTLIEMREAAWLELKSHTLELEVAVEHDILASTALEALSSFEVARQYETRKGKAVSLVEGAVALSQTNSDDAAAAVSLLLDAIDKLQGIPASAEPIGAIGRLLQSYQLSVVEQ